MSVCLGVFVMVCVCGGHVVSSTFVALKRRLHSLFQVKKRKSATRPRILREKNRFARPDAPDPTKPFKCLYPPSIVQRVALRRCPLMEVASWIVEDACT